MKCGDDWHLSFAPERTIEGDALKELRDLPQIVSGYSKNVQKFQRNSLIGFARVLLL